MQPGAAAAASTVIDRNISAAVGSLSHCFTRVITPTDLGHQARQEIQSIVHEEVNTCRFEWRLAALYVMAVLAEKRGERIATLGGRMPEMRFIEDAGSFSTFMGDCRGRDVVPYVCRVSPDVESEAISVLAAAASPFARGTSTPAILRSQPRLLNPIIAIFGPMAPVLITPTLTSGVIWSVAQDFAGRYGNIEFLRDAVKNICALIFSPTKGDPVFGSKGITLALPPSKMHGLALGPCLTRYHTWDEQPSIIPPPSVQEAIVHGATGMLLLSLGYWHVCNAQLVGAELDDATMLTLKNSFLPTAFIGSRGQTPVIGCAAHVVRQIVDGFEVGKVIGRLSLIESNFTKINNMLVRHASAPQWEEVAVLTGTLPQSSALFGLMTPLHTATPCKVGCWYRVGELPAGSSVGGAFAGFQHCPAVEYGHFTSEPRKMRVKVKPITLPKSYRGVHSDWFLDREIQFPERFIGPVLRFKTIEGVLQAHAGKTFTHPVKWYLENFVPADCLMPGVVGSAHSLEIVEDDENDSDSDWGAGPSAPQRDDGGDDDKDDDSSSGEDTDSRPQRAVLAQEVAHEGSNDAVVHGVDKGEAIEVVKPKEAYEKEAEAEDDTERKNKLLEDAGSAPKSGEFADGRWIGVRGRNHARRLKNAERKGQKVVGKRVRKVGGDVGTFTVTADTKYKSLAAAAMAGKVTLDDLKSIRSLPGGKRFVTAMLSGPAGITGDVEQACEAALKLALLDRDQGSECTSKRIMLSDAAVKTLTTKEPLDMLKKIPIRERKSACDVLHNVCKFVQLNVDSPSGRLQLEKDACNFKHYAFGFQQCGALDLKELCEHGGFDPDKVGQLVTESDIRRMVAAGIDPVREVKCAMSGVRTAQDRGKDTGAAIDGMKGRVQADIEAQHEAAYDEQTAAGVEMVVAGLCPPEVACEAFGLTMEELAEKAGMTIAQLKSMGGDAGEEEVNGNVGETEQMKMEPDVIHPTELADSVVITSETPGASEGDVGKSVHIPAQAAAADCVREKDFATASGSTSGLPAQQSDSGDSSELEPGVEVYTELPPAMDMVIATSASGMGAAPGVKLAEKAKE
ncbi:capsid protein [Callinectes sapidus toti-like virus 1]|nr:capsid protein [Callinectes sapidus toti-like virus 1]